MVAANFRWTRVKEIARPGGPYSLSTGLERSRQRSDQESFKTLPGKSGAPRRVASRRSTRLKDRRRRSSTTRPEWATSSHFAAFKTRPILEPSSAILLTFWATVATSPPKVKSSKYPRVSSEAKDRRSGWTVLQNRSGPKWSPSWVPSCENKRKGP